MRFGYLLLALMVLAAPVDATPGDTFSIESEWSEKPAQKRQTRADDKPVAPPGFALKKSVSNLGKIIAMVTVGDDVFIADAAQNRVLRLKSRNGNAAFETRSEYLIGFDTMHDLAASNGELYMSDSAGVWKIKVGDTLVATDMPKLIFANPVRGSKNRISLAMASDEKTLVIAIGNAVHSLKLETGEKTQIFRGSGYIVDIAISPSGSLWASMNENGTSYVAPLRSELDESTRLKLPAGLQAGQIQFWDKNNFPDGWPDAWASDLLLSLQGNHPMLARAQFSYGDISPDFASFIDGFSQASRFVGRREYWGMPSAMAFLKSGELIFSEQEQGALWVLEKAPVAVNARTPAVDLEKPVEPETADDKKPAKPELLRGSSISSASNLENDWLLRRSTQPDQEQADPKNKPEND